MNKQIDSLLNKKMDRKDFLKHVGLGALLVTGAGALLKATGLVDGQAKQASSKPKADVSYGAMAYGGRKRS